MDGDQFSLCWNNFHHNLSSGFHSLFQDEDLVDVTIAAGGKYLKAHKTVLSVCSPYFKELFRVNPCKHPIVILPDVNYESMSNLLTFMYQGEVSVSQEEIPTFMRVAEALKVKGLTENGGKDTNGLDSTQDYNRSLGSSSALKRKAPVKKLLQPSQYHKPLERKIMSPQRSPSHKSTTIPKQPRLDSSMDVLGGDSESKDPLLVNPKQEPIDPDDDEFGDQSFDNSLDMAAMLDTTIGETSDMTSSNVKLEKKSFQSTDICSPGTLQCIVGKRGNPRLIVDGHTFFKKSTYKQKSFWYCKHSRSQVKCPAVCWTVNGQIVKWPSGHTHDVVPEPFNHEEDVLIPIERLQEILIQTGYY